ncbi:hypothetical protein I6A84_21155 [Frankia sp. CNm7]|uniref:Uncharacterized protein n=1 Tax=Frankia nepalensis TaxID=1836974 RepID=A0A937RH06_9ACTN|nr:hypothetical protein [Frankia nepalensis]MBL7499046.1 hypothetical protein [Frankia nepalensis]MBL7515643.1 hypothetical protein [Frankia nepalensis]MBL7520530.1 hypothetical protein [Frankia nepalensis]MBL7632046.1 hypothetical protein [Frankia nepalensis]
MGIACQQALSSCAEIEGYLIVAPAVDLSVVALLLGSRQLAVNGGPVEVLRSARRLLLFASVIWSCCSAVCHVHHEWLSPMRFRRRHYYLNLVQHVREEAEEAARFPSPIRRRLWTEMRHHQRRGKPDWQPGGRLLPIVDRQQSRAGWRYRTGPRRLKPAATSRWSKPR